MHGITGKIASQAIIRGVVCSLNLSSMAYLWYGRLCKSVGTCSQPPTFRHKLSETDR